MVYKQSICSRVYFLLIFLVVVTGQKVIRRNDPLGCILPQYPKNGIWIVSSSRSLRPGNEASSGTIVNLRCNGRYKLDGPSLIECINGTWNAEIGQCLAFCPSLTETLSIKVSCTLNGNILDNCMRAVNGTVATFKCPPFYESEELNRSPFRVCKNGNWDQDLPTCDPVCGVNPRASEGIQFYNPWNVAIYRKEGEEQIFRCAGTLISERAILTAAQCVVSSNGNKDSTSKYTVAAGKSTNIYDDPLDFTAQYSNLEDIFIPEEFRIYPYKYISDIAVLIVKNPFNISTSIKPACLDWSNKYAEEFEYPNIEGSIAAPFASQNGSKHHDIDISFLNDTECFAQLKSHVDDDEAWFSPVDMFCSKYIDSEKVSMCRIDKGVGLITQNKHDNKYYLTGVLSVFPRLDDQKCDNLLWTLYTRVSKYMSNFIIPSNNLYMPIRRSHYQADCGVKSVKTKVLVVGGQNVTKGDYPWQVAIYTTDAKELICGGALINRRLVLTAAHCVTDSGGNKLSAGSFAVAVGKYYRNFDDPRDINAQFSSLKDIFIPDMYEGETQNYVGDIALLVTETSFILSRDVQPICMDWEAKYERQFLKPSVKGYVTGWGFTQRNQKPSQELKELEVPYVPRSQCQSHLASDYEIYLTHDKLCAGFLNEGKAVCSGDSGGGLVFKNKNDNRYYLAGIVSLSPQAPAGGCDTQLYALYTRVAPYTTNFILDKVQLFWA